MTPKKFIQNLSNLGERQGKTALKAATLIMRELEANKIPFSTEDFKIEIPKTQKVILMADDRPIPCEATCFVSGTIVSKDNIVSSLATTKDQLSKANINFSPRTNSISKGIHYFAPAIAVRKSAIATILRAKKVNGIAQIKKIRGICKEIYVGNKKDPKNIVFAHYDSIGPGALDNASGVAVVLETVRLYPETLKDTLYIFDGNEELSYDYPTYWGRGFRTFEKKYPQLLKKARKIIAVDCVGNGEPKIFRDSKIINLAFPIKKALKYKSKIFILGGDVDKLMDVYHSPSDSGRQIENKYLEATIKELVRLLKAHQF